MKKTFLLLLAVLTLSVGATAQKFAMVDMQYILKNIPDYEMMNDQLESVSKKWQQEIQKYENEAEAMYKKYQSDLVFLSAAQKKEREEAIVSAEQKAAKLQEKYFSPKGELYKKRTEMIKPIQDEIWNTIKELAKKHNFQLILDRSTSGVVFANPTIDISDEVLNAMGFGR